MKPPSNDATPPTPGPPKAAAGNGPESRTPAAGGSMPGNPSAAKPGSAADAPQSGLTDPAAKPEPGRSPPTASSGGGQGPGGTGGSQPAKPDDLGAGAAPPITAGLKVEPGKPSAVAGHPTAAPTPTAATPPSEPKTEPGGTPPKSDPLKVDSLKSDPPKADLLKAEPAKPSEPQKPGFGGAAPGGSRPGGAVTDGPIIDMKAKRVADPAPVPPARGEPAGARDAGTRAEAKGEAKAAPAGLAAGAAGAERANAQTPPGTAGPGGAPRVPAPTPAEAPSRGPGFGAVAAAGLLGGVIGAGFLFAVERAGMLGAAGDDTRINALDQRVSGQFSALDQRMAALAPRDAVGALDKRVAASEAALKPLPDAVKGAEATAKQALDKANAGGPAPAEGQAAAAIPVAAPTVPAELVARLDSLEQRVSALQEEPGREPPADAKPAAGQASAGQAVAGQAADGKPLAALDDRVAALEGKGSGGTAPPLDLAPKLAALQDQVEARTKAEAEAGQALGQRLDALQKALDDRVKAATEAVQTATQASRDAAEAGKTQAQEATKALDRRLQDQGEKIAALDKALALRAEASTVQAALRVVTADRVASALDAGAPYAEPLASLRRLETGDASRIDALAPFAEKGAPTADQLAAQFRPIAETLAASRKAAEARTVAASGDLRSRFLSMAESIVQVRRADAPATAGSAEADPAGKVQAALDRGALGEAARAFATLPQEAVAQTGTFGATLKARADAAQAVQALLSDAFKGMPTGVPEAGR